MSICLKVAGRKWEAQELPGPYHSQAWYGIFVIVRLAHWESLGNLGISATCVWPDGQKHAWPVITEFLTLLSSKKKQPQAYSPPKERNRWRDLRGIKNKIALSGVQCPPMVRTPFHMRRVNCHAFFFSPWTLSMEETAGGSLNLVCREWSSCLHIIR